jgi:uncharacterized protein
MPQIAARFMERGYAFVAQDVRGKARSEGELAAFTHEVADGADTLEWLADQAWSGGAVGMFRDSYYSFTQWAAAASGHPALRAIVPRVTTTSLADGWIYHQGVFCLYAMAEWGATGWVDRFLYDDVPDWTVRPLRDLVPSIRGGRRSASLDLWAATAPADRFWDRGVFGGGGPMPSRVRIPVLHSGGWWDVFQRAQVGDFLAMRRAGAGDQHLVMASTDHFDDELVPDGASVAYIEVDDEALEGFLPHSRAGARLLRPTPPGSGRPSSSDRPVAPRQRRMAPRRGMAPGCPSPRAVRRRCGVRRRRTRGRGRLGGPRPIGRRDDVDPRSGRISWPARST